MQRRRSRISLRSARGRRGAAPRRRRACASRRSGGHVSPFKAAASSSTSRGRTSPATTCARSTGASRRARASRTRRSSARSASAPCSSGSTCAGRCCSRRAARSRPCARPSSRRSLAWSAVANGDRLGGLVFSETEHHELRPALGARAALRLLQTRLRAESLVAAAGDGRDRRGRRRARAAAAHARRAARQPDLPDQRLSPARRPTTSGTLRSSPGTATCCSCIVTMPSRPSCRRRGAIESSGGGRSFSIETANEATRARYHERFAARRDRARARCAEAPGIRIVDCATDADPRSVLEPEVSVTMNPTVDFSRTAAARHPSAGRDRLVAAGAGLVAARGARAGRALRSYAASLLSRRGTSARRCAR